MADGERGEPSLGSAIDDLGGIYRHDPAAVRELLHALPEDARILLAALCIDRADLQDVGLAAAALCSEQRIDEMARTIHRMVATERRMPTTPVRASHRWRVRALTRRYWAA